MHMTQKGLKEQRAAEVQHRRDLSLNNFIQMHADCNREVNGANRSINEFKQSLSSLMGSA
jgi:hypothetical protein